MSKPSLKKKRTILDFFTKSDKSKPNGGVTKKRKIMASCIDKDSDEKIDDKKKQALLDEQPGPSNTVVVEDSDVESPDDEDSQKSNISTDSDKIPVKKPSQIRDGSTAWKGTPLNMLNKIDTTSKHKDVLEGGRENHRVLFKTPWKYDGRSPPTPYPTYKDKWDYNHVRLPCSNSSEYPSQDRHGQPMVRRRWEIIEEELLKGIPGPYELEERILTYNTRYFGKWKFTVLHDFFRVYVTEEERDHFFTKVLTDIARLALQLPLICSAPIPLLREKRNFSVTFSQQQIACLLANAFFCTFPRRNAKGKSEYANYPNINFNTLYTGPPSAVKFEKLRCIINYFKRVCKKMPCGTVTFTRQHIPSSKMPNWEQDESFLTALHVSSEGTIEDNGLGMLQVDFANKFLGGGVLGHGCVQEEIRFLICPEMIISRLITESLGDEECLIMKGCERFSDYEGYASKFQWKENYEDKTPRDSWGRMYCQVVAIDALVFRDYKSQFTPYKVKRELNKAYCGFFHHGKRDRLPAVCTGNWGCGAFGGDKQLKALIQLLAASKAKREMCYFTFDDDSLRDDLFKVHKFLTEKSLRIGQTWKMVKSYYSDIVLSSFCIREPKIGLFKYLMSFNMSALTSLNTGKELNDNSYHFLDHIVSQSYHPHKSHNANPTTYGAAHHYGKTTHRCGNTAFRQSDTAHYHSDTAHYHSDTAHHHRDPANHHGDDTKYQHRSRVHHDSYKTHHAGMATHSSGGTAQTHQHSDKTHKHSDTTHKHNDTTHKHSDTNHQHCDTKHQHGQKTHQDSHTTHHSSIATQSTYSYKNGHKDSDATETGQNKTLYPSRKETGV